MLKFIEIYSKQISYFGDRDIICIKKSSPTYILNVFLFTLILLLLNVALPNICNADSMPPALVKTVKVKLADFHDRHVVTGKIQAENSKDYYAMVSGSVDMVSEEQDNLVNADTVLIVIDGKIATASLEEAKTAFHSAEINFKRDTSLYKKKIISEELHTQSKVTLERARSTLVAAKKKYNDMIITAPFDGYLGVIRAKRNDEIKVGDYLFSIVAKESDLIIFVELPGKFIEKINSGSEIIIKNLNEDSIWGVITYVADYVSNIGTITLKAKFPANSKLIHGSFQEVNIMYNHHQGLAVPEKAVLRNNTGSFVYKVTKDNVAKQVYVNVATRTNDLIEIVNKDPKNKTLEAGDLVVIEGLTKVYDGGKINLLE